jgi:hypothetical protein
MDVIERAQPLCNEQLVLALLLTCLHCCCFCALIFIAFQKHPGKVSEDRKCQLEERELEFFEVEIVGNACQEASAAAEKSFFGGLCVSEVQKGGGTFQENRGFRVGSTTGMIVSVLFLRGCVLAGSFCKSLRIVTSWDF